MKANGRFFVFAFIFNLILGTIGFFILWGIRALTSEAIASFIICGVLFAAIALYVNIFIVKRAKLKMPYFIFGTCVNIVFLVLFTVLTML